MSHPLCRRSFLLTAGAGAAAFPVPAFVKAAGKAAERPDVLFLIAEDLKTSLGCYANPIVRTPNLDGLAASGLRFDNAQCMFPLCCPTRSSFLSGRYPRSTGVMGNEKDWNPALPLGSTLPEFFRDHGYEAIRCGKIFHAGNQGRVFDDKARWSRVIPEGQDMPRPKRKPRAPRLLYDWMTPEEREKDYTTRAWVWGPTGLDDLEMSDGWIAEQGVRVLRARQDKPLFLALGFHKTHLPLVAPDKYFDMYPPEKMPLPDAPEDCLEGLPGRYSVKDHKAFTDPKRREAIAAYYACCSYMDACAGRVLDALKETGRDRNTIVVFVGDHGYHLGEHLVWQKMTLFEESCRVPMMIRAPGVTRPSVSTRPVAEIELYPTLAELCGLPEPKNLETRSMTPLLRDPSRLWNRAAITTMGRATSLRTERYRYNEWGSPDRAELYDHQTDPGEMKNLAKDPQHKDVVAELSGILRGGWQAAGPEA